MYMYFLLALSNYTTDHICLFTFRSPGKQQNEFANITSGEMRLAALRLETDTREYQLSQQIKLGQRILIQVKKSS